MNRKRSLFAVLVALVLPWAVQGKPLPPPPHAGPSPLLYVRLLGPAGSRFTVYQAPRAGIPFDAPVTVALRPGYLYRVKLSDLPGRPGVVLYPTVEVRGTLQLPPILQAANYPAPVLVSDDDINKALAGGFVTKVVFLEHPERAVPVATQPDQPLETDLRPDQDMLAHGRALGRPMLIVRLGGKMVDPDEADALTVPHTLLVPGGKGLGQPPVGPCVPWECLKFDPRFGVRPPEEECLHDGGDIGLRAGIDAQGKLRGLDPTDTLATYADSHGGRHIAVSNRVCLCVPRYGVLRMHLGPVSYDVVKTVGSTETVHARAQMQARLPSLQFVTNEHVQAATARERPTVNLAVTGPVVLEHLLGTAVILGRIEGQMIVGTLAEKHHAPEKPLLLCKWLDKQSVQIGDVVTFYLKYTNPGGKPITQVVLSDSLTGRLEYVPGSARSDRDAVFTTQTNEAGSVVLRWEVGGSLLPGQSGMVSFQARVR